MNGMTDEHKYQAGERLIKAAVVMRFMLNAALSLLLAISYSGVRGNLYRMYNSSDIPLLPLICGGIAADSLFTFFWTREPFIHTAHFVLHILLCGLGYFVIAFDILNIHGLGAVVYGFLLGAAAWIFGLITLILGAAGRKKCSKAQVQQIIDKNAPS